MTRLEKARNILNSKGLDAIIVYDPINQKYLTDFEFSDGVVLVTNSNAFLITDFRYFEMAEKRAFKEFKILMPENIMDAIKKIISDEELKKIGFEGGFVSFGSYVKLKDYYPSVEFEDIGDAFDLARQIKDQYEIDLMQKAQDITDKAFASLLKNIKTDMTEIEVAAELEYLMRLEGAGGLAFDTIAVSADASALPHGVPRNVKLKNGFLTLDFGAKYDGYCSDMTRTVVIGKADKDMRLLYNTVLEAQLAALEKISIGAECSDVDKVARDLINSYEQYRGTFGHGLGHSVGLFIHENPRFSPKYTNHKVRVGEIYTVEPGIYLYGKYGCRIEDMIAIKEDGVYNFTHSPKDLIEII